MSSFRFNIATKLGVSAGLGIVLVAGMLLHQQVEFASIGRQSAAASDHQEIASRAIAAGQAVHGIQVAYRDARLADTPEQVDKALVGVQTGAAGAAKNLEAALKSIDDSGTRDRFTRSLLLIRQYSEAVTEVTTAYKDYLKTGPARTAIAQAWTKPYDELMASPALAALPNRNEVKDEITRAHVTFFDVRVAAWRWTASNEPAMIERIFKSIAATMTILDSSRRLTNDKTVLEGIDRLAKVAAPFKGLVETAAGHQTAMAQQAKAATRVRAELDGILEQAIAAAVQSAEERKAESAASLVLTGRVALVVGSFVILIMLGSAVFGALTIAKPVRAIGVVLTELAGGNKAVDIPYQVRGDEVGDAARAAANFRDNLVRMERMEAEQREAEARAAAEKRETEERAAAEKRAAEEHATAQRKADMHRLADAFESAVGGIVQTVSSASTELEAAATTLTHTADTTQQLSASVAAASEQASANVQSVASATDEMASSVDEISRQVQESSRIALEAVRQAQSTDARVTSLSQAASRIGDVLKLITSVAEQTNLLALNATIEAARAGEAGKGFAVVAQEVKALAGQTAKATDEIGAQIAGMQLATQESVAAIKEISGTIGRIAEIAATIAAAVEEQGAATQEIARNVTQAAQGTAQVAGNIGEVNRGAGETGSASSQVLVSARQLSGESNRLKTEVDKFLVTVRAA
jgi:methyl-accepting chemotaxis protein